MQKDSPQEITQLLVAWSDGDESALARLTPRILVDFARSHGYEKRGGGMRPVTLDEAAFVVDSKGTDMVALDDALNALAELDARQSRVVELRFFGGLTNEEAAEVLKVSE